VFLGAAILSPWVHGCARAATVMPSSHGASNPFIVCERCILGLALIPSGLFYGSWAFDPARPAVWLPESPCHLGFRMAFSLCSIVFLMAYR